MTQINRQTASGSPNYFGNQPDKICWDDLRAHSLEKWGHRRGFLIFFAKIFAGNQFADFWVIHQWEDEALRNGVQVDHVPPPRR
jgi:hypothetical protein